MAADALVTQAANGINSVSLKWLGKWVKKTLMKGHQNSMSLIYIYNCKNDNNTYNTMQIQQI